MKKLIYHGLGVGIFMAIAACNSGGGGGGDNKTANVPGPQGVIEAYGNPNIYCQVGQGSLTCFNKNPSTGTELCRTDTRTYTDVATLCQQINLMQQTQTSFQCNVTTALTRIYQENCQNIGLQPGGMQPPIGVQPQPGLPGQPTFPGNPVTPGIPSVPGGGVETLKSIQCELSGYNRGVRFQRTGMITLNEYMGSTQEFPLNNRFSCDSALFGDVKLVYSSGAKGGFADTMTLSTTGLNKVIRFSQSGFAGDLVKLEAHDDRGLVKFELACKGQGTFKKHYAKQRYDKFVCKGKANLKAAGSERQQINFEAPFDASLANSDIQLADGLTARITGESGTADSARIQFYADGVGLDYSVSSGAYLKTKTNFKASAGYRNVDVTCSPE